MPSDSPAAAAGLGRQGADGHTVYNIGETTLRILGFFPSGAVVARHDDRIEPLGTTDLVIPASDDVEPRSA